MKNTYRYVKNTYRYVKPTVLTSSVDLKAEIKSEVALLEELITSQSAILKHGTIPTKYKPKQLPKILHPTQKQLEATFFNSYKVLFHNYVSSAIELNTITFTVKKARLQQSSTTEARTHHQPLTSATEQKQFAKPTQTTVLSPNTAASVPVNISTSALKPTAGRKRKDQLTEYPKQKRQATMDCLLGKGSQQTTEIT